MNIMLKDTKYTRTVRALRNFVMTVLPLFFLALAGCRNEEDIPERLSGEDDVTVRLNINTRGTIEGGHLHDSSDRWFINGGLFPQDGSGSCMVLMIYSREQQRYVYSKLSPLTPENNDVYTTKVRIPSGETDFYVLYAPNRLPNASALPYYSPDGQLQSRMPWNFQGFSIQDVQMSDFQQAGFPVFFEKSNDAYAIPSEQYYNGSYGTDIPADNNIYWQTLNQSPWINPALGTGNKYPLFTVSGKQTATILPSSGRGQEQTLTIPLYRDFSRFKLFIASTSDHGGKVCLEAVAFLNFPTVTTPAFRNVGKFVPVALKAPLADKAGAYSYGYKYAYASSERSIRQAPFKNGEAGKPDYEAILQQEGYELVLPQYSAPYLPQDNQWQAQQGHPKLLLRVGYYGKGTQPERVRDYIVDVGEKGDGAQYDGPVYPNRDYRVFCILPPSMDQELIFRVEPWKTKEIDIPTFY